MGLGIVARNKSKPFRIGKDGKPGSGCIGFVLQNRITNIKSSLARKRKRPCRLMTLTQVDESTRGSLPMGKWSPAGIGWKPIRLRKIPVH